MAISATLLLASVARGRRNAPVAGRHVPELLLLLAIVTASSGFAPLISFDRGFALVGLSLAMSAASGWLLGLVGVRMSCWLRPFAEPLTLLTRCLHPGFMLLAPLSLSGAAVARAYLNSVVSGLLLSALLVGLALGFPQLYRDAERRPLKTARGFTFAAYGVAVSLMLALIQSSASHLLVLSWSHLSGDVVYRFESRQHEYSVLSSANGFELYQDDNLRASDFDTHRYAECLVHSAMLRAKEPRRVLLLDGGTGLVEREILRYGSVKSLSVVTDDRALVRLAESSLWLRQRSEHALSDPRVSIVEEEPIVFLSSARRTFDVVLVDVPDPRGYLNGKNYTVHFYRSLMQRLSPNGVATVQAVSARRTPHTFSSIVKSLRAAGFSTTGFSCPIPRLGEWSFVIAQTNTIAERRVRSPEGVRFLGPRILESLTAQANADAPVLDTPPSRLFDQRIVTSFQAERRNL